MLERTLRGVDRGETEERLDLGDVGTALTEPGSVGVAKSLRAQAIDSAVRTDGTDDLG